MHPLYPSPRVSQLDSEILDSELFSLLKQQLAEVFQQLTGKPWSYSQQPELWSLFLKLIIFKLTIGKNGSSYGLKLQNLKLSNHKSGMAIGKTTKLFFLGVIFAEFGFQKLQSYLYSTEQSQQMSKDSFLDKLKQALLGRKSDILKAIDGTIKLLKLTNFVSFLVYGKFPSIIHRILGVSLTPVVADLLKFHGDNVNFEFQNRQLVWNVMTEFLVFILPLLQVNKAKKAIKKFIYKTKGEKASNFKASLNLRFSELPLSQCAICIENKEATGMKVATTHVTNPYITNCGHIFCYICLATRFNSMENDVENAELCPRCGMLLTKFEEYAMNDDYVDRTAIIVPYDEIKSDDEMDSDPNNEMKLEGSVLNSTNSALEADVEEYSDSDAEICEQVYDDDIAEDISDYDDSEEDDG